MSLTAEILDALLESGATAEMIVAAVKADLLAQERAASQRRQKDTDRKRRSRGQNECHADSTGHTVTSGISTDPLDKEKSPTPPKEIKPLTPVSPNGDTAPAVEILVDEKSSPAEQKSDHLRPEDVVEAWNDLASDCGLPRVARLTEQRRRQLSQRLRDTSFDEFAEALRAIRRSKFCCGENDRGWRADFDFLLQPKSLARLLEGFYDGTAH